MILNHHPSHSNRGGKAAPTAGSKRICPARIPLRFLRSIVANCPIFRLERSSILLPFLSQNLSISYPLCSRCPLWLLRNLQEVRRIWNGRPHKRRRVLLRSLNRTYVAGGSGLAGCASVYDYLGRDLGEKLGHAMKGVEICGSDGRAGLYLDGADGRDPFRRRGRIPNLLNP